MRTTFTGLLLLMLLNFTVLIAIPAPVNLTILSHNFEHILQWSPGINSPPQTVFNLNQSCDYGKPTVRYENMRNTTLDVSKSLEDIYNKCTFFIWASVDNMTSSKIKISITPYEDTIIGPPTLFLSGCTNCLKIHISLPRGSGNKNQLDSFYKSVNFNISWKKAGEKKANQVLTSGEQYVLQNLLPGHKYCIRVIPQITYNRNTQLSAWHCEYTSKEESRDRMSQVLSLVSWSLGAFVIALGVLVLTVSLFYVGCLCKLNTFHPKALSNIVQVYYLNPEQTVIESAMLPVVQLSTSKNGLSKNSSLLNLDQKSQHEELEENYGRKADTEDDEDYMEEDEKDSCTYMGRIINHSSLETKNSEENSMVSTLPLLDRSSTYDTRDKGAQHLSVTRLSSHIHSGDKEYKEKVLSEVSKEKDKLPKFRLELVNGSDVTGNVSLFSVTLSALGQEEEEEDLDEDKVCLLPKPLAKKDHKGFYRVIPLEEPVQMEIKTDNLITTGCQRQFPLCSFDLDVQINQDTASGYAVTHTGGMLEQNSCLFEETKDSDTGYITR